MSKVVFTILYLLLLLINFFLTSAIVVAVVENNNNVCVSDEDDLKSAIDDLNDSSNLPDDQQINTIIDIIADTLFINNNNNNGNILNSGLNITNNTVIFNCALIDDNNNSKKCNVNAQSLSRHFIIMKSNITFNGIRFSNGLSNTNSITSRLNNGIDGNDIGNGGGSLYIESSIIQFINCEFINNTAITSNNNGNGGAIYSNNSIITFVNCLFDNNKAQNYGAVMNLINSVVTITDVTTSNNVASNGTIALWESKASFMNWVKFFDVTNYDVITNTWDSAMSVWHTTNFNLLYSSTSRSSQINHMKSIQQNNIQQQQQRSSTCIKTRAPVPDQPGIPSTPQAPSVQEPSAQAPPSVPQAPATTPSMTPMPVATTPIPVPTSSRRPFCFSSYNHVDVQGIGYITLDQLRIGDYVMSGDGIFTQVYGFGHYDQHHEATFLQISFHVNISTNNNNNNSLLLLSSPLEISLGHLIMLDRGNKRYPIRASDVRVGDILSGKTVKHIDTVNRQGVYAPLTQSGNIIVNDIIASNYIDLFDVDYSNNHKYNWYISLLWNQHVMGHILFTPQRIYCYYNIEYCKKEHYINGYGYLSYVIVQCGTMLRYVIELISNTIMLMLTGITALGYRMIISIVLLCIMFILRCCGYASSSQKPNV